LADAFLNNGHSLEPYRLINIIFFSLWKETIIFISWGIKDT